MAPKRGAPSPNALSPQDSPSLLNFPRANSPSSGGFAQLLTRPAKWFTRSASTSKLNAGAAEPRTSSSSARKPKISRPTDPRPILETYNAPGARSVMDLSSRAENSLDLSPSVPSSPVLSPNSPGSGDLRSISRRAWSKSADDLGKLSSSDLSPGKSFQEKVAQYRNRSNSNTSTVTPIPDIVNVRQPFPKLKTPTPPSSSPPHVSNMPAVTISPASEDRQKLSPTHHVHTRSHSFTPKIAAKLAAPRIPTSPKRKGSTDSDMEKISPVSVRSPFPFGFGGGGGGGGSGNSPATPVTNSSPLPPPVPSSQSPINNPRATGVLLAPPSIEEASPSSGGGSSTNDSKRSSQIVYNSGFINRLVADVPSPTTSISLSKGWKPFKMELKGSKLYFYKPPSDRTHGIKDLFPTGLVPPTESDLEGGDTGDEWDSNAFVVSRPRKGSRGDEAIAATGSMGRKKRAFWGRKSHPDLVVSFSDGGGKIEKGTFEALVHEAVFATTFTTTGSSPSGESALEDGKREQWKDFASSVLLSLPSLVSPERFEAELLRCCEYLVSGSSDELKEEYTTRVGWLAGEYLRYHGTPVGLAAWEEWRKSVIPGVSAAAIYAMNDPSTPLPTSSSLQALYMPTPFASPNIGTFSPRPGESPTVMSVMDSFGGGGGPVVPAMVVVPPSPSSRSDFRFLDHQGLHPAMAMSPSQQPSPKNRTAASPSWMNALDVAGLSRDVLLTIDPNLIARSLTLFHKSVLEHTPENLTAQYILGSDPSSSSSVPIFAPFFGSDEHPHWLTKMMLMQILGADTSNNHRSSIGATRADALTSSGNRAHSRSEIISAWIRVGERCRLSGDECSWRAILAALCSAPVARLERVWKKVDPAAYAIVESWILPAPDGEPVGVKEPRITPWGAGIDVLIKQELAKARGSDSEEALQVGPLDKMRRLFEGFRTSVSLCPRKMALGEGDSGEEARKLVTYWRDMCNEGGGSGALAVKFQRVEQFMSLSLAIEPRKKGMFQPHYWSRAAITPSSQSSLIPLLFPEPLPTLTLIDRSQLLRGRVDSDASDIQFLRAVQGHLRPDNRRTGDNSDPIRDAIGSISRGGTVIPVFHGDLLLVVHNGATDSDTSSRPSSRGFSRPPSSVPDGNGSEKAPVGRAPSIRVKPSSSQSLDRKSSVARRSSLPTLSNPRNYVISEASIDRPLRVLVKAGTLNRLVDVLVHGLGNVSVSVADDNGEMSLREGNTRNLSLDQYEFSRIWWIVFRSFVTPLVFFELLRKKYIQAQIPASQTTVPQALSVTTTRIEVLDTMKEWVSTGGGAQDIVDDTQLLHAMQSFLDSPTDHLLNGIAELDDNSVRQSMETLKDYERSLRRTLQSCTMRPPRSAHGPVPRPTASATESRVRNLSTREPPDVDRVSPEELVDNLDGMACAAFSNVTEEDLFATCDLLEVQTADRVGWISPKEVSTSEDTVDIQTMYSHIQDVEPSSTMSEGSQDSLYRLLPAGVRSCIRAFCIMRKWIVSKIVAPRLGLRIRQTRMELFLQAIEVARLRNMESNSSSGVADQPCVRSFVEAVLVSAVLSAESRTHQRAWQNVAYNRGVACDSLTSLLYRRSAHLSPSKDALTVDMGWLLERLLDIIATPDLLDPVSQEGECLIQFDKRRHLYNLITNTPSLLASRRLAQQNDLNRRAFERLNNIEREVFSLLFDPRIIKDEAQREGAQAAAGGPSSTKKIPRPFQRLVAAQIEKNRRDRALRLRIQKEKLQEQTKHDKRDDLLNRAMRPRPTTTKQHRNKKSMSAFLNFMRPLSSAFTSDTVTERRTPSELDFTTSGKPSLVLSMVDARVTQFINNERSFTFLLDTEDGGHYVLQAMNKKDMSKWLETIGRVAHIAAKRRLTYLGNALTPQIEDHLLNFGPVVQSKSPTAVFGVELDILLRREAGEGDVIPGTLPSVVERCLSEVESRGLTEVGIYRIAGATSEINGLRDAFNRGESPIDSSTDIHAVCDLLKSWFRVLPEPTFPSSSYHNVIEAMKLENLDARLSAIRAVIQDLPQANFDLLRRVSEHLDKVTDFEEQNQMTAEALAIVFSPNLLRAPQNDFGLILANMGYTHKLVKALITHFHVIFDDDPDADGDAEPDEDELDSPILEEDEDEDEDDENVNDVTNDMDIELPMPAAAMNSEPLFPPDNVYTSS